MDMKNFLEQEVKPAFGCTEPGAAAYAAAIAARELGRDIESVDIRMSVPFFKNGRSVGLPGLNGLRGNALAAAIGALGGNADKGLMVLQDVSRETVEKAGQMLAAGNVKQDVVEDVPGMWVEVTVRGQGRKAQCALAHKHDRVDRIVVDESVVFEAPAVAEGSPDTVHAEIKTLDMRDLWDLAQGINAEVAAMLLEGAAMNMAVARAGMEKDWGIGTGVCFDPEDTGIAALMRRATACATEVRMGGGEYPVMSSAGSGNHGITAIIPLAVAARELGADDSTLAGSLALSHLVCAFLKAHTGRLSPICGCAVAAGAGAAAGLVLMRGGDVRQAERAVVNVVTSLVGMLCDGGKENCSLKVGTAAAEAWAGASLALHGGGIRMEQGLISPVLRETGKILEALTGGVYARLDMHMASIMLKRGNARQ